MSRPVGSPTPLPSCPGIAAPDDDPHPQCRSSDPPPRGRCAPDNSAARPTPPSPFLPVVNAPTTPQRGRSDAAAPTMPRPQRAIRRGGIVVPTRRREGNACRRSLVAVVAIVRQSATTPPPVVEIQPVPRRREERTPQCAECRRGQRVINNGSAQEFPTARNGDGDNDPPHAIAPSS